MWDLDVVADGARITSAAPVNVFNRDRHAAVALDGSRAAISTVTTGHTSGFDLSLGDATAGRLSTMTDLGVLQADLSTLGFDPIARDGEGLDRRGTCQRLPAQPSDRRVRSTFDVP